jgi:hypothetical protein
VLIQRVMEITLKNAFDLNDFSPMPGASAQERCTAIFLEILEGGLQYPGTTRAHFHNLLAEGQVDAVLEKHLKRFLDDLAMDLQERGAAQAPAELKLSLMQIFSVILVAVLAPSFFEQGPGLNLRDPDARRVYIHRLVQNLLGE